MVGSSSTICAMIVCRRQWRRSLPRAARRDRVDASHLEPGQARSRPEALHPPHRARVLAKSTAWKDYCDGQRPLEQAIKRLGKVKGRPNQATRQVMLKTVALSEALTVLFRSPGATWRPPRPASRHISALRGSVVGEVEVVRSQRQVWLSLRIALAPPTERATGSRAIRMSREARSAGLDNLRISAPSPCPDGSRPRRTCAEHP